MYNSRNGFGFNIQDNDELKEYLAEHTTNASKSCTLIWFVDQVTGETKLWTGEVKDPYNIRYQNTEELDQIKITLLSFLHHKTVFSSKIKNLTKVIIIHEATVDDYLPRYDEKGKPLNHDQFVIVDGTCSLRQGNGHYFEHEYALAEPLYGLRYWATETQTITNMTSITISELNDSDEWEQKTYTQDETNLYYILKRMLQITGYRTSVEDCTLDTLISIQDQALLTNSCKGINDNFMASNAYQCIIKMAKYLDRLPVLYFNPNYEVQDSNNLDESKKEYLLFFEQKVSGKIYQEDEVFTDISGYCECELAAKDAGTVVVDAQNLVSSTPVWYPGYGYFCAATGDRGKISVTEDDYVSIKLPNAIENVLMVKVFEAKNSTGAAFIQSNKIYDVPCVEEQEWLNIASANERKKYLYYKKYTNIIEVNHSKFKGTDTGAGDAFERFYSIQYIPAIDARIKMSHSNKYETSITQTDAALDSKAFGTFLKNYAKENCNTDYSLSRTYYSLDKILKPGDSVEMKNGGRLVVASTDITRKNNSYFVVYVLNEYRVKRSSLISASNRIDNKIINKESTMKRFINVTEKTIKIGLNLIQSNNELDLNYICNNKIIVDGYTAFLPTLDYFPNIAFTKLDYSDGTSNYFSFNINKCQTGKSIILNINTEDSTLLFGGGLKFDTIEDGASLNIYHKYTDSFGKINNLTLLLSDYKEGYDEVASGYIKNGIGYYDSDKIFEIRKEVRKFVRTYPSITQQEYIEKESIAPVKIENLTLLKDTSEALNISFQVNFQEENLDTILFDKFIEINALVSKSAIEDTTPGINSALGLIVIKSGKELINESITDLIGIRYSVDYSRLRGELVADNVIRFTLNNKLSLHDGDQIILVKYHLNGDYTHIYPLIAKAIRTKDEYIATNEIYLEFYS